MSRGRYPADRNRDLMNLAAAVVGAAGAAQVVHRDTENGHTPDVDYLLGAREALAEAHRRLVAASKLNQSISYYLAFQVLCEAAAEMGVEGSAAIFTNTERRQRVIDAAREYARTGGEAHHELLDAVAALERAERAG